MGAKQHKDLEILVSLETNHLDPGDNLAGVVHINCKNTVDSSEVHLKFKGKEIAAWDLSVQDVKLDKEGSFLHAKNIKDQTKGVAKFLNYDLVIYRFEQACIPAGHYSIPFSFKLPETIPGSFKFLKDGILARIVYRLKAVVTKRDKTKMSDQKTVYINHLINNSTALDYSSETNVVSCCRHNIVKLQVSLDKLIYFPGQNANITVQVDNSESRNEINYIICKLHRTVVVNVQKHGNKMINQVITEKSFKHKVRAKKALLSEQALTFPFPIMDKQETILQANTVKGKFVECVYYFEISAVMSGSPQPKVSCFVPMGRSAKPPPPMPVQPTDWQPSMITPRDFHLEDYIVEPSAPPMDNSDEEII